MSELSKLRKDMKAEFALLWGGWSSTNSRVDDFGKNLEQHTKILQEQSQQIAKQGEEIAEQGQEIAEQGQRIAEQGQRIAQQSRKIAQQNYQLADAMLTSAKIASEISAQGKQTVGRLQNMERRFSSVLEAVEKEMSECVSKDRFQKLEERVKRLEDKDDPAA